MKLFVFILALLPICFMNAQTVKFEDKAAILKVMTLQEKSWNDGNIDGFMKGYWKSEKLTFIGSSGINKGWENTLARYKKAYPDKAAMGKLFFEVIEFEQLGELKIRMTGKWQLTRSDDVLNGYFTLIWEKIEGRWLITYDHSS